MTASMTATLRSIALGAGVPIEEILVPLHRAFHRSNAMPRNFRSSCEPTSRAGNMKIDAVTIEFPSAMPYIAGVWCMGNVRLTGAWLGPAVNWFGEFRDAKIVVKGMTMPLSLAGGVEGMRIADVIDSPLLRECPDRIVRRADLSNGNVTLCTDNAMSVVETPTWMDAPARAA